MQRSLVSGPPPRPSRCPGLGSAGPQGGGRRKEKQRGASGVGRSLPRRGGKKRGGQRGAEERPTTEKRAPPTRVSANPSATSPISRGPSSVPLPAVAPALGRSFLGALRLQSLQCSLSVTATKAGLPTGPFLLRRPPQPPSLAGGLGLSRYGIRPVLRPLGGEGGKREEGQEATPVSAPGSAPTRSALPPHLPGPKEKEILFPTFPNILGKRDLWLFQEKKRNKDEKQTDREEEKKVGNEDKKQMDEEEEKKVRNEDEKQMDREEKQKARSKDEKQTDREEGKKTRSMTSGLKPCHGTPPETP
ncbi:hypothetical protein NDU88_004018 [Pleurodeles waltl]|uniref:Uncharacterized protein n=1 Tax=Pleurodeles waltl TaxID=8319 RepID=A0AAV7TR92_PLEWA|nr:hypothetical protein NDU88_004018 [Pleurodeles waltl]